MKIITQHINPPIPVRHLDWCAWIEGEEEGFKGWGDTEQAAIEDLREKHPDVEDEPENFHQHIAP